MDFCIKIIITSNRSCQMFSQTNTVRHLRDNDDHLRSSTLKIEVPCDVPIKYFFNMIRFELGVFSGCNDANWMLEKKTQSMNCILNQAYFEWFVECNSFVWVKFSLSLMKCFCCYHLKIIKEKQLCFPSLDAIMIISYWSEILFFVFYHSKILLDFLISQPKNK